VPDQPARLPTTTDLRPQRAPAKVQDHCVAPDRFGDSQRSRSAPQL